MSKEIKSKAIELTDRDIEKVTGGCDDVIGMEITCPKCGYTGDYTFDPCSPTLPPCRVCGSAQD